MVRKCSGAAALIGLIISVWVAAAGCSGNAFAWAGTWVGERKLSNEKEIPEHIAATIRRVEIKIGTDLKFQMIEAGMPYSGTVVLEGDEAKLKIERIMGKPAGESGSDRQLPEISLKPRGNDQLVLNDPGSYHPGEVVLKRQS